ncbi:hypothetical protein J8273_0874 [Carpediemonas membranifera]|uniref:Uncharacterized protein n=1 Tax=Carpediemonas membranifera TaxID=201153 RepID=A0A8J6BA90_9EUKA|nr:hypothetical protein J8273_0874 [Carpediemonas membranifera]|eukprot:KAG9397384.1 hypothetical protein J8273_0874 [Carpediemonas membranifera]
MAAQNYLDFGSFSFFFEVSAWPLEHLWNNVVLMYFTNSWVLVLLLAYMWESLEAFSFSIAKEFDSSVALEELADSTVGDIWSAVLGIFIVKFIYWRTNNIHRHQWKPFEIPGIVYRYVIHNPIRALAYISCVAVGRGSFWVIDTHGSSRIWSLLWHYVADLLACFVAMLAFKELNAHPIRVFGAQAIILTIIHIAVFQDPIAHESCLLGTVIGVVVCLVFELLVPPARKKVREKKDPVAIKANNELRQVKHALSRLGKQLDAKRFTEDDISTWATEKPTIATVVEVFTEIGSRLNTPATSELLIEKSTDDRPNTRQTELTATGCEDGPIGTSLDIVETTRAEGDSEVGNQAYPSVEYSEYSASSGCEEAGVSTPPGTVEGERVSTQSPPVGGVGLVIVPPEVSSV